FLLMLPLPPTSTLFPYTTLFRSFKEGQYHSGLGYTQFQTFHGFSECVSKIQAACGAKLIYPSPSQKSTSGDGRYSAPRCDAFLRSEEHTSELQSRENLVCRLLLE